MRPRHAPWLVALCLLAWAGLALSYETYSVASDDTNCRHCHGYFGAQTVGHDAHQLMMSLACYTCHWYDFSPVHTNSSAGEGGIEPIGCVGCHGRAEDGTGTGTQGYGMGLRQFHWNNGDPICGDCHTDADPAVATPSPESTVPPWYGAPGIFTGIPSDPCSPAPGYDEDYAPHDLLGLDNDGDHVRDEADPDCSGLSVPGETSGAAYDPVLVTARDQATGRITLTFDAACECTDNVLEYGDLADVRNYLYAGQVCSIGTSGTYDWTYPSTPASVFFLIVGHNTTLEGSYGLDGGGNERPEDVTSIDCPMAQDLVGRCD